jgi:16S rRNA (guanine966-N2)-methyltransferase
MARAPKYGVVRIIGGRWKRTPLTVLSAPGLRPTPDRVRKTVFDWLTHALNQSFEGMTFLDLFAGSGALGLEAASRGASRVVLVERDPDAASQLRATVAKLDTNHTIQVREGTAESALSAFRAQNELFDVVFLDPPFGTDLLLRILDRVRPLCHGYLYVESDGPIDCTRLDALGLTMRRSGHAGAVFYHLLQCKNNEETVDASSDLSGDVRPADSRT